MFENRLNKYKNKKLIIINNDIPIIRDKYNDKIRYKIIEGKLIIINKKVD
jgi:hypothetical protein